MFNYKRKNYFVIYCLIIISILLFLLIKTPGLKGGIDQEIRIITKNPIIIDTRNPINESLSNILIALKDLFRLNKDNFETLNIDIDFYKRRKGKEYFKHFLNFNNKVYKMGHINLNTYIINIFIRLSVFLPLIIIRLMYMKFLRYD